MLSLSNLPKAIATLLLGCVPFCTCLRLSESRKATTLIAGLSKNLHTNVFSLCLSHPSLKLRHTALKLAFLELLILPEFLRHVTAKTKRHSGGRC